MTATKRDPRAARNVRTNAQKREAALAFLNHPDLTLLPDREISRRTKVSQPLVSKLRKAVISLNTSIPGAGLIARADGTGDGHDETIFDGSALSSYAWVTADPHDQRRFVDAVGLQKLYEASTPDHRDAFLARLLAQLSPTERPEHLPSNIEMYLDRIKGRASGGATAASPHKIRGWLMSEPARRRGLRRSPSQFRRRLCRAVITGNAAQARPGLITRTLDRLQAFDGAFLRRRGERLIGLLMIGAASSLSDLADH